MTEKIASATPEEYVFAREVNRRLAGTGASVHPFTMIDSESARQSYRLTLQCGGKRTTLSADAPFHYDPPEDVVAKVKEWIDSASAGERWMTDLERADGDAP
jgi:hypothetical protein